MSNRKRPTAKPAKPDTTKDGYKEPQPGTPKPAPVIKSERFTNGNN